jgi:hypothetical protein
MKATYSEYKNFGKVYEMREGDMVVRVTTDIGPRIIYFGTENYNLMYEDTERLSSRGGEFFDKNFGVGSRWYNLGGHRLWKSPEDEASYSIDNTPVTVIEKGNSVVFYREAEKTTGLIKEIEIEVLDDSRIRVEHRFTNTRSKAAEVALWALTVLRRGGKVILPLNENNKGFLPARNFVYWSYSKQGDKRFSMSENYALLEQSSAYPYPYKFGVMSEKGVAGYLVDGYLFSKTFDVNPQGEYPDFCCNFESYTNDKIIECETLGELVKLAKDETSSHTEVWKLDQNI